MWGILIAVGIVCGALSLLCLVSAVLLFCLKKKRTGLFFTVMILGTMFGIVLLYLLMGSIAWIVLPLLILLDIALGITYMKQKE